VDSLSLTTVGAPFREMSRRAVDVVLGMIRGDAVPALVNVPTELVVRRSCGCLPTASRHASAPSPERPTAIQLRQALTYRSAQLPDDWAEWLSATFASEMRGESRGAFLALLNDLVQVSLLYGER